MKKIMLTALAVAVLALGAWVALRVSSARALREESALLDKHIAAKEAKLRVEVRCSKIDKDKTWERTGQSGPFDMAWSWCDHNNVASWNNEFVIRVLVYNNSREALTAVMTWDALDEAGRQIHSHTIIVGVEPSGETVREEPVRMPDRYMSPTAMRLADVKSFKR